MAGLDKILEDIRSESAKAVDSVMREAKAEYDAQMDQARKEADEQAKKILDRARLQAEDLIARADSAAALEGRRMLLHAKQELIGDVITRAKEAFVSLPAEKYFAVILKLVTKNALPREGEICFNRHDFDRLPKDFATKLVAALPKGASLSVSREDAKIVGGFILKYDGLEQNLSVEEIFEEKKDVMTDAAGKVLFS
jgi:V/A-type H+-transporting ATPase subunit E